MTNLYYLCGVAVLVLLVNWMRVHRQITKLKNNGLYPKEGEQLTPNHISMLVANGEHAYAARLVRRLYGVSLRKAVDQIRGANQRVQVLGLGVEAKPTAPLKEQPNDDQIENK
jgi:hypothetical protein